MDFSRVKTFLLLFLLAVNFLIGSVIFARFYDRHITERESGRAVITALQNLGVSADESVFSLDASVPRALDVIRDPDLEAAAAGVLLGPARIEDQGGNIYYYAGENGWAKFRSAGRFEIGLKNPFPVGSGGADAAVEILSLMGISTDEMSFSEEAAAYGVHVTVSQMAEGRQIFGHSFTMSFDDIGLFEMSGTLFFGDIRAAEASYVRTPEEALLRFASRMKNDSGGTYKILSINSGYQPVVSLPGVTRLAPVYSIQTESESFLVDAVTCEPYLSAV